MKFQPPLPPDNTPDYSTGSYCGMRDCCLSYTCNWCGMSGYLRNVASHFHEIHRLEWKDIKRP